MFALGHCAILLIIKRGLPNRICIGSIHQPSLVVSCHIVRTVTVSSPSIYLSLCFPFLLCTVRQTGKQAFLWCRSGDGAAAYMQLPYGGVLHPRRESVSRSTKAVANQQLFSLLSVLLIPMNISLIGSHHNGLTATVRHNAQL